MRGEIMHIFITGGTRGIGHGLVLEFLKFGHHVSFTGTTENGVNKAIKNLKGDVQGFVCDVRVQSQIEEASINAIKEYGPIDVWINNAGVSQVNQYFKDLNEEEIRHVIDVNIIGMVYGTHVALNLMKKQGYGKIYNMEGLGSNNMMIPKTILYGGSKRFLSYFSNGVNKELKDEENLFVGTLQPGMVFTDLLLDNMTKQGMTIARILGSHVEDVTSYLVKKIIKEKRQIKYLTFPKTMWRFLKYPFVHQHKEVMPKQTE